MIKEEVKKNKDEFDQTFKSKADNYSLRMINGFGQDKKEPVLIVNPRSGGGSTAKDWETLFARIKEALGKEPHFVFTEKSRDGTTLARELIKKIYQYIVAVGGNGTINEVVNGYFIEEISYSDSSHSSKTESGCTITQQKKNRKWKWKKIKIGDHDIKFPRPASMMSINPGNCFWIAS